MQDQTIQKSLEYSQSLIKDFQDNLFYHQENETYHYPYAQECEEMDYIQNGDLDGFLKFKAGEPSGGFGIISPDPTLNAKYLSVVNMALSARAAVHGGVPDEKAFSLYETCCRMITSLPDSQLTDMREMVYGMQIAFLNLVAEEKGKKVYKFETSQSNLSVAKNYIFSHLHGRLSLEDVAASVGLHPNYLNSLFKQEDGITVHQYILCEKVNLVKNMLTYSTYSYIEIANYLGFSSQSHLGQIFKKYTGQTLNEYRKEHQKEFLGDSQNSYYASLLRE